MPLFRRNLLRDAAELAYRRVVEQARQPGFFADIGVPDTIDGRFELIAVHAFLYLHRLKREQPKAGPLGQRFFEAMLSDFDRSLREMGTGDLSVGREVKRMAQASYGRIDAYERGFAQSDSALKAALGRNLFGTASVAPAWRQWPIICAVKRRIWRNSRQRHCLPARSDLAAHRDRRLHTREPEPAFEYRFPGILSSRAARSIGAGTVPPGDRRNQR
jgi:cytochrome b pre-mRNA-processing protein 3